MPPEFLVPMLALAALAVASAFVLVRHRRREARLRRVLDLADGVQALLAAASQRMATWSDRVGRVMGDLGSETQRALDGDVLIGEAKRDLLQHRLWLQQRGLKATSSELDAAIAALERTHYRLATGLTALDQAGAALIAATGTGSDGQAGGSGPARRTPR